MSKQRASLGKRGGRRDAASGRREEVRVRGFLDRAERALRSVEATEASTPLPEAGAAETREQMTRRKLIEAGGEVFAEVGFHGATVREICRRAGANVAAVNYHFRDKAELYKEVLHAAHCAAKNERDLQKLVQMPGTAREHLTMFITHFLRSMLSEGRPAWQGKLMSREMVEPTEALNEIVNQAIRPQFLVLQELVGRMIGGKVGDDRVRFAAAGVISQCLFWKHTEPVIKRLYPDLKYDEAGVEEIARHVVAFSMAALEGMGKHRGSEGKSAEGKK